MCDFWRELARLITFFDEASPSIFPSSLTLAPGAMQVSSVAVTATDSGGLSRGQWIAIIGIGAGLGLVITAFAIQSYVAGRS